MKNLKNIVMMPVNAMKDLLGNPETMPSISKGFGFTIGVIGGISSMNLCASIIETGISFIQSGVRKLLKK